MIKHQSFLWYTIIFSARWLTSATRKSEILLWHHSTSISCNVKKKTGCIRLNVQTDLYSYADEFPVVCECTITEKLACNTIRIALCFEVDNHRAAVHFQQGQKFFLTTMPSLVLGPPSLLSSAGSQASFLGTKSANA